MATENKFTEHMLRGDEWPAAYDPKIVEANWDQKWSEAGFCSPCVEKALEADFDDKFVMVIPPPNVTGNLHLGHALTIAIQDCLTRWHRMNGKETLWVPGTDHAGIATQVVVEKRLAKEGVSRHDLGRDGFLEKVWEWKNEHGDHIVKQLRKLGASVDWDRLTFTLDDERSAAVQEAFVRMFEKGLIYRGKRLVNWCCTLRTAISDIEVDYIDVEKRTFLSVPGHDAAKKYEFGVLTSFAYPVEDSDEKVVVATTRLETMLGDTAVAVHPEDPRHKHLHGKFLIHPFNGRRIPIILDGELVDMEFGTGAVKITPAHDPNDYQCGMRHKLEFINVLTEEGCINHIGGEQFEGMKRFDARVAVEEALKEKGLLIGKENNKMRLGLCSRTKDVIEPMLKPQWWVDCKDMADRAVKTVREGELKIKPEIHEKTWYRWLENIRDWCISRQLWWGHRIPAYLPKIEGKAIDGAETESWIVARSEEEALKMAAEKYGVSADEVTLEQDPDVLDTWFSSGLFPFSVMKWPTENPDLDAFFPGHLLETGHDILFFWVARMVMMSLTLMDELPFKEVYLHAMVRDKMGRKMSKSLGNVIDPLEVIHGCTLEKLINKIKTGNLPEKEVKKAIKGQSKDFPKGLPECGADALRFGLLAYTIQGRDINLDIQRVVGYRQFCNKLWNAVRFSLMNLPTENFPDVPLDIMVEQIITEEGLAFRDQWIISRLNNCIKLVEKAMKDYTFGGACTALYNFWLYELCGVYLEAIKPVMQGDDARAKLLAQRTLYICLEYGLKMLHPMMPFVTEELWQHLPGRGMEVAPGKADPMSIMVAEFPKVQEKWDNATVEKQMELVSDVVHAMRSACSSNNILPNKNPNFFISTDDAEIREELKGHAIDICTLAKAANVEILEEGVSAPIGCAVGIVNQHVQIHLNLKGMVDFGTEIKKLEKKYKLVKKAFDGLEKKIASPQYQTKVPEKVKAQHLEKLSGYEKELADIEQAKANFETLM